MAHFMMLSDAMISSFTRTGLMRKPDDTPKDAAT